MLTTEASTVIFHCEVMQSRDEMLMFLPYTSKFLRTFLASYFHLLLAKVLTSSSAVQYFGLIVTYFHFLPLRQVIALVTIRQRPTIGGFSCTEVC